MRYLLSNTGNDHITTEGCDGEGAILSFEGDEIDKVEFKDGIWLLTKGKHTYEGKDLIKIFYCGNPVRLTPYDYINPVDRKQPTTKETIVGTGKGILRRLKGKFYG